MRRPRKPSVFMEVRRPAALWPVLVVAAWCGAGAWAQATTQPASQPASQPESRPAAPYWLRVTADRVNVRSRADGNSQIVAQVNRDDVLEAVGSEHGWHKIVPPIGVYSLVSAEYIQRTSPERGIVKVDTTLRVRVGSDIQPLDPLLAEVQTRLKRDAEVQIIGQLGDEWLKIVPPEGVYVYISDQLADSIFI